jgi:hypothetical protein
MPREFPCRAGNGRRLLLAAAISALMPPATVGAVEISLNDTSTIICSPGRLGPNGLPVPYANRAHVGEQWLVEAAGQFAWDPDGDTTVNPWFSFFIPLKDIAGFMIFSRPVEEFHTSERMRDFRNARRQSGVTPGDLYFLTMIQILDARKLPLDLAFHLTLKTTTGKGLADARHINAPAYYFDLTAGRSWAAGRATVSVSALISFIAWQAKVDAQDDAMGYGVAASVKAGAWIVASELAGYAGWIENGDRPLVARVRVDRALGRMFGVYTREEVGIIDQPLLRCELGMTVDVSALWRKP